jgi:MFS family permease
VNSGFILAMIGFSLTFIVAEITPLFLITVFTIIASDTNGLDHVIWIIVSQFIAIGAICPFVGALSDAFGRKNILLASLGLTVVGQALLGSSFSIAQAIAAQVLIGLAIGIQLLSVIAAVTELVPTSQRGITIGYVVCGLIPFMPASLYGQYIAAYSWRYIVALLGGMAILAFFILFFFYHPPRRENAQGLTTGQILGQIDYLGGFLSTVGVVLFLIGLNWGGQDYPWSSAHVISTLTLGLVILLAFFLWEYFGAKHPLFPMRLIQNKRLFIVICFLCLTSGINYIPVVVFWVVQCYTVYEASFKQAGIDLLPLGFCIIGGAIISAVLISAFPKRINIILIVFCVLQTAGKFRQFIHHPIAPFLPYRH